MQTRNFYCVLPLILLLAACMIGIGYINIFRKDDAWHISEWALRTVKPQRTPEWERDSTVRGVILLVFGLAWLSFILYVLFS